MPLSAKCVKCGSTDVVPGVRVMGTHSVDLRVRVDADPHALLFKGTERSPLEARVCGRCGYTEFYATDPATLLQAWRHSRESEKE